MPNDPHDFYEHLETARSAAAAFLQTLVNSDEPKIADKARRTLARHGVRPLPPTIETYADSAELRRTQRDETK